MKPAGSGDTLPADRLRVLRHEVLYRGKVFDLVVDEVEYPSGARGVREIARHPGGAVIVPLLDHNRLVMVEQFRYPLGKRVLELPAGKLSPAEDPKTAAARELEEETGFRAASLQPLGSIYTTPGFCDEELFVFLAMGLTPSADGHRREEGERGMSMQVLPFAEVVSRIGRGEIRDAKTIVGVFLAERVLVGSSPGGPSGEHRLGS